MDTDSSGKRAALDIAFPSITVMAVALVVALLLIFICGWKLVLLEQEQQEIAQDRLVLERDRDAFLTYGSELPQLEDQRRQLLEEMARQEAKQKVLAKTITELETRREALSLETNGLAGAVANLQAQAQALNRELAEGQADLRKTRPELAQGKKELALLRAQENALKESIQNKQKTESTLVAAVAGLERSKAQAEEFVKRLSADKKIFDESQKKHDELLGMFENILARSGALTDEYAARMEDLNRIRAALDHGQASLASDIKSLAGHLDGIRQDRAMQATLLKTSAEQAKILQAQVEGVTSSNRKFGLALESVQGLDKKLQAALATEVRTLAKWAGEDAETRAKLAAAAHSLGESVDNFKNEQTTARGSALALVELVGKQREELQKLNELAAELVIHAEKSRETSLSGLKSGASLAEIAQNMQQQAERLKSRIEAVEVQGSQLEKLMDGERERLSELSQLARYTKEELGASRHQDEEIRAALAEILALLRKPEQKTGDSGQVSHE